MNFKLEKLKRKLQKRFSKKPWYISVIIKDEENEIHIYADQVIKLSWLEEDINICFKYIPKLR